MNSKAILSVLAMTLAFQAHAANDDLILQTRLDQGSTSWLIDKTRIILNNADLGDGLEDTTSLDNDPILTMNELSTDPVFLKLQDLVTNVFHVDAKNAVLRLKIPSIYYKVHSLHAVPHKLAVEDPKLNLEATAQIQGVDIGLTDGIQVDYLIPNRKTGQMDSYMTASFAPTLVEVPSTLEPAEFDVSLEAIRDSSFHFNLKGYKLDNLPLYISRHMNDLLITDIKTRQPVGADQISVNPVTVRLCNLTRSVTFDSFKPVVQKKMKDILSTIINQVGLSLKTSIGPRILKLVFSKSLPSSFAVSSSSIYSRFSTAVFTQPDSSQLSLGVAGDFCTDELYKTFGQSCVEHMPEHQPIRIQTADEQTLARAEIQKKLASGDADVTTSVSEDYLNRLLQTTIDAKLWDSMLKEQHMKLGPKGAFVILNEASKTPQLFLDVIYEGEKGITGIFINPKHPIRFPLRLNTSLAFEVDNGTPKIIIKIEDVLSTVQEIINGIPEYQMPSHLVRGIRKKIAGIILKMAATLEGKNAVELTLPIFKGIELEKTSYEVSAYGRLNLYFKI
jgi:hypothetical protein